MRIPQASKIKILMGIHSNWLRNKYISYLMYVGLQCHIEIIQRRHFVIPNVDEALKCKAFINDRYEYLALHSMYKLEVVSSSPK